MRPTDIQQVGNELAVKWDDGSESFIPLETLRRQCPCAACNEERLAPPDPFHILKPAEMVPLKPIAIEPIGFYAYRIVWSAGHDSGLFTIEHLRELGSH